MANNTEKNSKNNKKFFKSLKAELKKVTWPTPKQVVNSTVGVVVIVLITAVIVLVLDLAFEGLNKYGINRLRTSISNTTNEQVENNVLTDNTDNVNETNEQEDNTNSTENTTGENATENNTGE